jgi:uncharacterized protein YndB with AHSA1/START domain
MSTTAKDTTKHTAKDTTTHTAKDPTKHETFRIERTYPQPPARVFAAWASVDAKAAWFRGPREAGWTPTLREMDFRVGGRERAHGRFANGRTSAFEARYFDIVPDARIVLCYDMYVDDRKISVSLATVEVQAEGNGTKLVYTEQGVFLDGYDDAGGRERGTRGLLDQLEQALQG